MAFGQHTQHRARIERRHQSAVTKEREPKKEWSRYRKERERKGERRGKENEGERRGKENEGGRRGKENEGERKGKEKEGERGGEEEEGEREGEEEEEREGEQIGLVRKQAITELDIRGYDDQFKEQVKSRGAGKEREKKEGMIIAFKDGRGGGGESVGAHTAMCIPCQEIEPAHRHTQQRGDRQGMHWIQH